MMTSTSINARLALPAYLSEVLPTYLSEDVLID